jgi:hypothetical protein
LGAKPDPFYEEILTGPFVDLGIFNMGKIANVSDNLPQKLTLAIKSGKYKIGKLKMFLNFLGYKLA